MSDAAETYGTGAVPAEPRRLVPPPIVPYAGLDAASWGMLAFLVSEAAFFGTLVMTYLSFIGQQTVGPEPREVLSLPLVIGTTCCLLASSGTIHLAEKRAVRPSRGPFCLWWGATIALGMAFLAGTGYEWSDLMAHQLTIDRNLFGTTFYTLVGFHGLHVTAGLVAMLIVLALVLGRNPQTRHAGGIRLVAWYWHFVDAVWLVVFTVVYIVGR